MDKIAIIGSGLNGLAVAFGLYMRGFNVKLYEEGTFGGKYLEDFRTSFISHQTLDFFDGIAKEVSENSGYIKTIYSFKNKNDSIVELEGSMGYVVDNSLLKKTLVEFLQNKIEIAENYSIKNVENTVNGTKIDDEFFKLTLCCSGANSQIHKNFGVTQNINSYNQTAIVFDISHTLPHENIALEIFDDVGIIAILPKKDEYKSSIILNIKDTVAKNLANNDVIDFIKSKTTRARNIGEINSITTPICRYPLSSKYMFKQNCENIIFIGDAFHSIHPVLGQGFNMSMKDISKLCNTLTKAKNLGIPIERAAKDSLKKNIINHLKMEFATRTFGNIFVSENKIIDKATSAGIFVGSLIPSSFKTKILQKLL